MAEIVIHKAPDKYQLYLNNADNRSKVKGGNGKIDTDDEARRAAEEYFNWHSYDCEQFLQYMEGSGYASLRLREFIIKRAEHVIATFEKGDAFKELQWLVLTDSPPPVKSMAIDAIINILERGFHDSSRIATLSLISIAESKISSELQSKIVDAFIKNIINEDINVRYDSAIGLDHLSKLNIPIGLRARMVPPLCEAIELEGQPSHVRGRSIKALINLVKSDISLELKSNIIDSLVGIGQKGKSALKELEKSDIPQILKSKINEALR